MKKTLVFLLFICVTSCDYFDAKKIASEDIYDEEIKTINWNEVDTYPTFSSCDNQDTKSDKKACFENTLSQHITSRLQDEIIVVTNDIEDTVLLAFQISETGIIEINKIEINDSTESQIPNLRNILSNSLDSLPKIFPAIKRDQPVKTEFKMPVIIAVN